MESAKIMETSHLIKEKRVELGFTQKSLADVLNITDKAISKWERGICLPDVTLLPKLALLLDIDLEILISKSIKQKNWTGLIDISNADFSQIIYDKPLVYYLLCHFLLLGIRSIYVLTNEKNRAYLETDIFKKLGFCFFYDIPKERNLMIVNHPWFLFGSDLTQQFQGAMLSERNVALAPEKQVPVAYFTNNSAEYFRDKKKFICSSLRRTLGRGMICFTADNQDSIVDIAVFIKSYQKNSHMLLGSLEEIAFKQGIIDEIDLMELAENHIYGESLRNMVNQQSVAKELDL